MLQYVLIGIALGSIYAIASASLVVTYVSTGVLNFAFGSMAYVVARFFYWLNSEHGWRSDLSGVVALLVFAPLLGAVLYFALFQFLRGKSTLIKLVATIGLSVALPAIADLVFGTNSITSAPGLAGLKESTYRLGGVAITTDQVITYGFLLFVVIAGTAVLRLTDVGLRVRAMVDSEALTSLSGTDPARVALGVWVVSTMLAGLAGILVAPTNGLDTTGMTTLMAAAFAAVVAARLRSLPGAVAVSLLMGIVTDVIQYPKILSPSSSFYAAVIPTIPFGFILVFLAFYLVRSGSLREGSGTEAPLDAAIRPAGQGSEMASALDVGLSRRERVLGFAPLAVLGFLPLIFHGSAFWLGLVASGICYAITFLTFTVVTGEGGMLWLSQIIFAGVGALGAGQFAKDWHVPVLAAIVLAALIAGAAGAVLGMLTIRLGDLYVGLVTLTFGLLVENLVFTRQSFQQQGLGVPLSRPSFANGNLAFAYVGVVVFALLAVLTVNLRRSTSGLALRAVRDSEAASRTLGLSVVQVKVIVGAIAAFVAAIGGGWLAMYKLSSQPDDYHTFLGLVWLAVVVAMGIRSITGAALAGMLFSLMPGVFQSYVPARWGEIPTILFGLGALGVARNPEGVVAQNARELRRLMAGVLGGAPPGPLPAGPGPVGDRRGGEPAAVRTP